MPPGALVRKNINSLTPAEITSLRNGIAAMKARPESDPTSWLYQANIHGTTQGAAQTGWNQCEHGIYPDFQFLGWHRLYVYYFERILRAAANDPNLTLPYWNYSDTSSADNRAIPLPYRNPVGASNALFEVNRGPGWNQGARLGTSAVDTSSAFSRLNFLPNAGQSAAQSFGGGNPGTGRLEFTPHNVVHSNISGFMGDPRFAAQDPIFWAHHCNIDRLWVAWLALGGGRANPTSAAFLNQQYTFFDENGNSVTRRIGDFLDTVAVGYQYASLGTASEATTVSGAPAPQATEEAEEESEPRMLSQSSTMTLRGKTHSVDMPSWISEEGEDDDAQVLTVEELDFEKPPVGHYEVYINLPEGAQPDYKSKYFIGNLAFFGFGPQARAGHKPVHTFDISEAIKKLKASGEWKAGQKPKVTFVKRGPELPPGVVIEEEEDPPVKIGKISISTR